MSRLIGVIVILFFLWAGYWFVGSTGLKGALERTFEEDPRLETAGIRVAGFPNRFDTTLTQPRWQDAGFAWSAPFFQSFSLSYRPTHLVFVWPQTQRITTPNTVIDIAQDDLRASMILDGISRLALDRISIVGEGITLSIGDAAVSQIETFRAATRRANDRGSLHDFAVEIQGFRSAVAESTALFANASGPPEPGNGRLSTTLRFTAPVERATVEQNRLLIESIEVSELDLTWGDLGLVGKGTIEVDSRGRLQGRLDLTLRNWRTWLQSAERTGLLRPEMVPTWEAAAEALASLDADPATLMAPLSFQNGFMSLGPLPLGPAPRLQRQ